MDFLQNPFSGFALLLICAFVGALFLRLRQPVLIACILVGIAVGPAGSAFVAAHDQIDLLVRHGPAVCGWAQA